MPDALTLLQEWAARIGAELVEREGVGSHAAAYVAIRGTYLGAPFEFRMEAPCREVDDPSNTVQQAASQLAQLLWAWREFDDCENESLAYIGDGHDQGTAAQEDDEAGR